MNGDGAANANATVSATEIAMTGGEVVAVDVANVAAGTEDQVSYYMKACGLS